MIVDPICALTVAFFIFLSVLSLFNVKSGINIDNIKDTLAKDTSREIKATQLHTEPNNKHGRNKEVVSCSFMEE